MKCLMFNSKEEADVRNSQEAKERGCAASNVTQLWWNTQELNGKFYLQVNEDSIKENEQTVDINFENDLIVEEKSIEIQKEDKSVSEIKDIYIKTIEMNISELKDNVSVIEKASLTTWSQKIKMLINKAMTYVGINLKK